MVQLRGGGAQKSVPSCARALWRIGAVLTAKVGMKRRSKQAGQPGRAALM
jgi:hypothetical protein